MREIKERGRKRERQKEIYKELSFTLVDSAGIDPSKDLVSSSNRGV